MGESFSSYDEWKKTQVIDAPFTQKQVKRIKKHQNNPDKHPYTCNKEHKLKVAIECLYCLKCNYIQTWVHRFTVEKEAKQQKERDRFLCHHS